MKVEILTMGDIRKILLFGFVCHTTGVPAKATEKTFLAGSR
jgi:hypothetical protein